jgi:hypothetical protein
VLTDFARSRDYLKRSGDSPRIALDQALLVSSGRSGSHQIWIKDLRVGEDRMLTASRTDKWHPGFSRDGSRLSFGASDDKIYVMPVSGGAPEVVCEKCGEATDWSPDGKRLLGDNKEGKAWVLEVASHRKTDLLPSGRRAGTGVFSPDNRWCVFGEFTTVRTYVAPLDELPIPESAWGSPSWIIGGTGSGTAT